MHVSRDPSQSIYFTYKLRGVKPYVWFPRATSKGGEPHNNAPPPPSPPPKNAFLIPREPLIMLTRTSLSALPELNYAKGCVPGLIDFVYTFARLRE